MSVLCEAISVIVRVSVLEEKYAGGVDWHRTSAPNATYCSDGVLTRIGFMHPDDCARFLDHLALSGLTLGDANGFVDVVVVDQFEGPTLPCPWVETSVEDGVRRAWLAGTEPGDLAVPANWEPSQLTKWTPDPDGGITAVTDGDVTEESFHARTSEDE